MQEWEDRGFKNKKCIEHFIRLHNTLNARGIQYKDAKSPDWLTDDFCVCHRSNLLRKLPEHYRPIFEDISDNLEYIWPI